MIYCLLCVISYSLPDDSTQLLHVVVLNKRHLSVVKLETTFGLGTLHCYSLFDQISTAFVQPHKL